MSVDAYSFGRIRIDGAEYTTDVIVFPGRVRDRWWRREGHSLELEDLSEVLADPPATLVVGTGYYGNMQVPQQTLDALRGRGIEVRVCRTGDAVKELNRLQQEAARVVAALHLSC
jgi:hypothetical protein